MPTTPISPKVSAGINWGIIATLAVGVLTSITPDMLAGLGPYQSMVFVLIGAGITALRAYLKPDPLRDIGAVVAGTKAPAPVAPVSFAPTQARIDALPALEATAPEVTAPAFTPTL
jgi:hypothetical protein